MKIVIRGKYLLLALLVLVILVIIGGSVYLYLAGQKLASQDTYQAVFLINGQVYFGKIIEQNRENVMLTAVYYLQNKTTTADVNINSSDSKNDWTLVKLGSEFHGPTDQMVINRDNILFIEELRSDSRVIQAISQNLNQASQ
ncbi:MAG: hypothetical protein WC480_05040 [Patescibacteria group bacterium]